jgi:glycine C-acetyltransferase
VFEALLDERDAVISDALNHASLIDGIRLSKAQRLRYANRDMAELEQRLAESADARYRLVVTDGVFSMDGYHAPLDQICALADRYDALVLVDDSHAVGVVGPTGRGTPELFGVTDRVDIVTGTLGKALGGASGGYVSGRGEIVQLLKQRARPYLFSNSVAPAIVAASLTVLDLLTSSDDLRTRVHANAARFRAGMEAAGFDLLPGEHPIVPVMFGDALVASRMADQLFTDGVYAVAFSFPVVPKGQARIRVQLSAAHSDEDVDTAVAAFTRARELTR